MALIIKQCHCQTADRRTIDFWVANQTSLVSGWTTFKDIFNFYNIIFGNNNKLSHVFKHLEEVKIGLKRFKRQANKTAAKLASLQLTPTKNEL